ncbi:MAG: prepilin-type N-terminal cleavage/methylation domain-containing protein, partial [Planctomycetota bacterium]
MTLRTRVQSAFTITELLVVVAVVALLIAVGTPAVISSLRSINRSLADTQLRVAIVGARDAAIRNAGRGDAMAVFTFEPGQRTQIYVCLYAGTLTDRVGDNPAGNAVQRDVFIPDPLSEPISLPNGWSVRGYVPAFNLEELSQVERTWYELTHGDAEDFERGNWVFPETGFFDRNGSGSRTTGGCRLRRLRCG